MKICLLAEPSQNPVLTTVMDRLRERHTVTVRDPQELTVPALPLDTSARDHADVYLLKSRSAQARSFAWKAERAGAVVVNGPAATTTALDRWAMSTCLDQSGVPAPRTRFYPSMRQMAADTATKPAVWPLVVKSRISSRGDLVRLVHDRTALLDLLPIWGEEPVIAQQWIDNDGFDIKVWVIGGELSAARRRGALEVCDKSSDVPLDPDEMPAEWSQTAIRAGAALGLDLFGVDLLIRNGRPFVIDVNAFPGFRGARDPAASMLRFLECHTAEKVAH
jgi:ribosomal protein S6--L-glutamate ligase